MPRIRFALFICLGILGCRSRTGTSDPPAKLRLEKIFEYYQAYTHQKKQPPADEQAFKDFLGNLSQEERDKAGIGMDVDAFLISPRDGLKYVIRYKLVVDPGGATQAVAWEQNGVNSKRFVALNVGYVQEYTEEDFKDLKK